MEGDRRPLEHRWRTAYAFGSSPMEIAMYRKVLLAYDGSVEGRLALREGARLAQVCGAEVFLLAVAAPPPSPVVDVPIVVWEDQRKSYEEILAEGGRRLEALGFTPRTRLETGDPAMRIGAVAREIGADLVVVGHRRLGFLARWWSRSVGNFLVDHVDCSVLVARMEIGDDQFAALSRPA